MSEFARPIPAPAPAAAFDRPVPAPRSGLQPGKSEQTVQQAAALALSASGEPLASEVLAHTLQLDLYRIDLSAVVSKYIGETGKNLGQVFDAAEDCGAILLFDETDALFGKHSGVRDSHDRYANIEVSSLLQRVGESVMQGIEKEIRK